MELYYVMSVVDRSQAKTMIEIYEDMQLSVILGNLGEGTATSEHLLLYDLAQDDKAIISTIASEKTLKHLISAAKRKMYIDIPGNGIMLALPMKSVSGGKTLTFFTEGQDLGRGRPTMSFENELIITILNEGYSDTVMEAARAAGATGGTVIHAKGTGKEQSKKFYGVSLAEEKDMIYILAPAHMKASIMKAINQNCGVGTPPEAISFSVPVSEVVGVRNFTEDPVEKSEGKDT